MANRHQVRLTVPLEAGPIAETLSISVVKSSYAAHGKLVIHNSENRNNIIFKITSSNNTYEVYPNSGMIAPGGHEVCYVTLNEEARNHFFQMYSSLGRNYLNESLGEDDKSLIIETCMAPQALSDLLLDNGYVTETLPIDTPARFHIRYKTSIDVWNHAMAFTSVLALHVWRNTLRLNLIGLLPGVDVNGSHCFQEEINVYKHHDSDSNKSIGSASGMWGVNLLAAVVLVAVVASWEKIFRALAICALVMMLDLGRQIYERHLGGREVADGAAAVPEVSGATLVQDAADEVINEHGAVQDAVEEEDTYESHNGAPDLVAEMVQVANEVPSEHYPPLGDRSASSDGQPSTPDKPPTDEDDEFHTPLNY